MNPLGKIVSSNNAIWRLAGFTAANIVGMAVILGAFQLYRDASPILSGPDSFMRNDYVILSKKVGALQALGMGSSDFSPREVRDIEEQPFVVRAGVFTPAAYSITGSVSAGGMGMSSFLFFESVPDPFLDVKNEMWKLDTVSNVIPIIIPRNYLNLYNYGFSRSQGLPQVSEDLFGALSIDLRLSGNGHTGYYTGRIAGFSDRLNTILVPERFMEWSNSRFGGEKAPAVSRVIVEVTDASSDEFAAYLLDRGYETEGERAGRGTGAWFLRLVTGIVITVGLVITVLAFFLLVLGVFLMLQKNSEKLRNLMLLGFSPARVSRPFIKPALALDGAGLLLALAAVWLMRHAYAPLIVRAGGEVSGYMPTVLLGIGLTLLSATVTTLLIRRKVIKLW